MQFKVFGAAVLLGSAVYYSFQRLKKEHIQILLLQECIELLQYIYRNIECFQKPLLEIIEEYNSPVLESLGFFEKVKQDGLIIGVKQFNQKVPQECYDTIMNYAISAGKGYKEEELQLCRYTYDTLHSLKEKISKENINHTKVIKTIPFMLALSIVLLFW